MTPLARRCILPVLGGWLLCLAGGTMSLAAKRADAPVAVDYPQQVQADQPVLWWRFSKGDNALQPEVNLSPDVSAATFKGELKGGVIAGEPGPQNERYPIFSTDNAGLKFPGGSGYVRVSDPGSDSPLDFTLGDAITLEAWVYPSSLPSGQHVYVLGKGRTNRNGFPRENQNYALRLTGQKGGAAASFLFRSRPGEPGKGEQYHRWTSKKTFPVGSGWHHVAVSYTFGEPASLRGYIDGKPVEGTWDMGGATAAAPVVDDDQLWIGSALGGSAGNTFRGGIDEVAIYRSIVPAERIRLRFRENPPPPNVTTAPLPEGGVLVEIQENIGGSPTWDFRPPAPVQSYVEPAFAFREVPHRYNERGIRVSRSNPYVLRTTAMVEIPSGRLQFLVRSRSGVRLFMDGKLIVETPFHNRSGGGHNPTRDYSVIKQPRIWPLAMGDNERVANIEGDGKVHRFRLEVMVGAPGKRMELGETLAAWRPAPAEAEKDQPSEPADFVILSPARHITLTDESWLNYIESRTEPIARINAESRRLAAVDEKAYWDKRHATARSAAQAGGSPQVPEVGSDWPTHNSIDHFIAARLQEAGKSPADLSRLTEDFAFLRRVTIDVIGTPPTREQIEEFLADPSPERRSAYIDRLLQHPGWADNWTGYWQDVLAENPNILKPTLNNSGPFRWWIHESFLDNKPLDRFATELILMEGDKYAGAPAGFAMAAQNDVPMAAKAHIVGQAFLGVQMKCARCHDAPFHDLAQKDLFSIAAMLKRGEQKVPMTSSIPLSDAALDDLIVKVTLKPGVSVPAEWPFQEIVAPEFPEGVLRNPNDSREQLAALITSPENTRFANVMVNRLWQRYMGRGIVQSVDDWEHADPTHPELLEFLADEFVISGYDFKHLGALILKSHAYQRAAADGSDLRPTDTWLFPAPLRRRMTAEQVIDSLFHVAGKPFRAGQLNFDLDGARGYSTFLNFGRPTRAWEFTSLSNERDRPSLALPLAQDFVSALKAFGWRASRQDPQSIRDHSPTIQQPASLANGVIGRRITRLSDDGALTELAVAAESPEQLIRDSFRQILTREPTAEEISLFTALLEDGFATRLTDYQPEDVKRRYRMPNGVSWSNHLRPEANRMKLELEQLVQQGDPPSVRLQPEWRERMEDMIWALINSPEFVFQP